MGSTPNGYKTFENELIGYEMSIPSDITISTRSYPIEGSQENLIVNFYPETLNKFSAQKQLKELLKSLDVLKKTLLFFIGFYHFSGFLVTPGLFVVFSGFLFRGGAVSMGPQNNKPIISMNKKEKRLALKCALSEKIIKDEICCSNF